MRVNITQSERITQKQLINWQYHCLLTRIAGKPQASVQFDEKVRHTLGRTSTANPYDLLFQNAFILARHPG